MGGPVVLVGSKSRFDECIGLQELVEIRSKPQILCRRVRIPFCFDISGKAAYFTFRLISRQANYMTDHLDITFAALSDPTRRAILARLAMGETTVKELSEPFSISAPSITKHLKVLERAGLIARSRDAQRRPCRLEAAPLREAAAWIERYRRFWAQNLNRLDDYLSTLEKKEKHARKSKR